MVQTLGEVPDSFSVTAEHTDRLAAQAERFAQGEILRAIDFLAAAIAAVKDGSEPRIQLEMALLKATQPQADLSLQALMFRIEQLEARLGGGRRAPEPAADGAPRPPPAPPRRRRARALGAAAPVGAPSRAEPERGGGGRRPAARSSSSSSRPIWPRGRRGGHASENGDARRARSARRGRSALEGDRLTVAFPPDAAFVQEEGRGQPRAGAARAARPDRARAAVAFELQRGRRCAPGPRCSARRS